MSFYKWTVEIEIHPTWVADGFDLTNERLCEMLQRELPYAKENETIGCILEQPDPKQIRVERGYKVDGYKPFLCDRCECFPCVCVDEVNR
jgi:hypothetical protein